MTYALLFLAGIMGTVIWWLGRQTVNVQPWVASSGVANSVDPGSLKGETAKIGLGIFLVVVTSLFALFISAYAMRMELSDWQKLTDPTLLWANTVVLVLASVAMQASQNAARARRLEAARVRLLIGGLAAIVFLLGQGLVWQQLRTDGFFGVTNPANAFFYLITGLHALHLIGGLFVWARTTARLYRGAEIVTTRLSIELCTAYWHFLLLVWVLLFGLLLMT